MYEDKHKMSCEKKEAIRNEQWDAYYCPNCLTWLEGTCNPNLSCYYRCWERPDVPPVE